MSEKIYIRHESDELHRYKEEVAQTIDTFKRENGIRHIIGISGDADPSATYDAAEIVSDFIDTLQGGQFAILTGGTNDGVPKFGIEFAKAAGIPTIGVYPEQGRKYSLGSLLDLEIETYPPLVGPGLFGTETPTFVNLLGGAAIIGGGWGTLTEVSTILKTDKKRLKDNVSPIYLSPISGTGGVADVIYNLPGIDALAHCLPDTFVNNGYDAALFLKNKLTTL